MSPELEPEDAPTQQPEPEGPDARPDEQAPLDGLPLDAFPLEALQLEAHLNLEGPFELLLPNQAISGTPAKVTARRGELVLSAEPAARSLELKLEFAPEQLARLAAAFDPDPAAPVQRFAMHDAALAALLPELAARREPEAWLRAGQGAILNLGHYSLIGSSVWLDDAVGLFQA